MSPENRYSLIKLKGSYILYDDSYILHPTLDIFDREHHRQSNRNNSAAPFPQAGIGRAMVAYFQHDGVSMVLKHYYRGGLIARFLKDQYLGVDIEKSRAFREWRLLKTMRDFDLPVPEAVAARVKKSFLFYRADLITRMLQNTRTLSDVLEKQNIDNGQWEKIGVCIKRFHNRNIYHADLNARNILIDDDRNIYLIDFDNSYIRSGSDSWKASNLARLHRSLSKFKRKYQGFNFSDTDWQALLRGYDVNS